MPRKKVETPESTADRLAALGELAIRFDLHCREASRLRDLIHGVAQAKGLSAEEEKRLLLDAHEANEATLAKRQSSTAVAGSNEPQPSRQRKRTKRIPIAVS